MMAGEGRGAKPAVSAGEKGTLSQIASGSGFLISPNLSETHIFFQGKFSSGDIVIYYFPESLLLALSLF